MYEHAIAQARLAAERFLDDHFVLRREHLEIERWTREQEVDVYEGPLEGAQAQLIRTRHGKRIILSESIADPKARRFNTMHELAHLILRHASASISVMCTPSSAREQKAGGKTNEVSANAFTSAVLLPARQIQTECNPRTVTLDVPWALSERYDVSILASAIRMTELSSRRCAAVFSRKGKVVWCAESESFGHRIRRGTAVRSGSQAHNFFSATACCAAPKRLIADIWLESVSGEIIEHSTWSPDHGTVLSMLHLET